MPKKYRTPSRAPLWRRKVRLGFLTILAALVIWYYQPALNYYPHSRDYHILIQNPSTPIWLLATPSAAAFATRRAIIRSTWQALYNNRNLTFRFVLSAIDPKYIDLIQKENETYGDIISLPWLEETAVIANTIKSIEFFRYLVISGFQRHEFVSKIDDDSFLNVPAFWHEFIEPRLGDNSGPYLIARTLYNESNSKPKHTFIYPGGQFYTLSWKLMETLVQAYIKNPITEDYEDVLVGRLLDEVQADFTFVNLDNRQAFDYNPNIDDPDAWEHRVLEDAINPHKMKSDETYLEVAKLFDKQGLDLSALNPNNG